MQSNYCLSLSANPVRFESVSAVNSVFFDESNRQVVVVRSNGAGGIVVKGENNNFNFALRIEDRGEILSIKLSPDNKVVSLQRSSQSIEFFSINTTNDVAIYSQPCKVKSNKFHGFFWSSVTEIVFVTDKSVEHYQVFPEKMALKLLRAINMDINWFLWLKEDGLCMISSGPRGNNFYPITFKNGTANKLQKYDLEVASNYKECLRLKDFLLVNIYLKSYLISLKTANSDIFLYHIKSDGQIRLSHTLKMETTGKIAINVIDNLVAVHHQASKTTCLFDIQIMTSMHNGVCIHRPISKPISIQPIKLSTIALSSSLPDQLCELYSSSWAIFVPNIILDAKLGCFWSIHLNLSAIYDCITEKIFLLDFLLSRRHSKEICLAYCADIAKELVARRINLPFLAAIFEKFNRSLVNRIKIQIEKVKHNEIIEFQKKYTFQLDLPVIDQTDIIANLFDRCGDVSSSYYLSDVITEYLTSLSSFQIPVHPLMNMYLFNQLLKENQYYKLYQYLQYYLITDSKDIAYQLLSLDEKYIPAHQLALDMLKRLNVLPESILEILLSTKNVVGAIRYAISTNSVDKLDLRRCENIAKTENNEKLLYMIDQFRICNPPLPTHSGGNTIT